MLTHGTLTEQEQNKMRENGYGLGMKQIKNRNGNASGKATESVKCSVRFLLISTIDFLAGQVTLLSHFFNGEGPRPVNDQLHQTKVSYKLPRANKI